MEQNVSSPLDMPRIIWTCWFQGEDTAPEIVKAALNSWRNLNPGWQLRVITEHDALAYAPGLGRFDLDQLRMTRTAFSDLLRIFLLHEYGGVWADATAFCNKPLDDWLPQHMDGDFFAFEKPPGGGRDISTWFMAANRKSVVIDMLAAAVSQYWARRTNYHHYHWLHKIFNGLNRDEPAFTAAWAASGKLPAAMPLRALSGHMLTGADRGIVSTETPLYKLTYKYDLTSKKKNTIASHFIKHPMGKAVQQSGRKPAPDNVTPYIATMRVRTNNIGDHVQVIAAEQKLEQFGLRPDVAFDRDSGLQTGAGLDPARGKATLLMSGWFKRGNDEWPPHPQIDPIFVGFHIRPHRCPALTSKPGIDYLRQHAPIGCRDAFTADLLRAKKVKADDAGSIALTLPRRIPQLSQTRVFVVSRDRALSDLVRPHVGDHAFMDHYIGTDDHRRNMATARQRLDRYCAEARLVVTTFLHCAIVCIAMGIPVILFYPRRGGFGHVSDKQRFSAVEGLIPVHDLDDLGAVDWLPRAVDAGDRKLALIDRIKSELARRGMAKHKQLGPFISIAEAAALIAPPDAPSAVPGAAPTSSAQGAARAV